MPSCPTFVTNSLSKIKKALQDPVEKSTLLAFTFGVAASTVVERYAPRWLPVILLKADASVILSAGSYYVLRRGVEAITGNKESYKDLKYSRGVEVPLKYSAIDLVNHMNCAALIHPLLTSIKTAWWGGQSLYCATYNLSGEFLSGVIRHYLFNADCLRGKWKPQAVIVLGGTITLVTTNYFLAPAEDQKISELWSLKNPVFLKNVTSVIFSLGAMGYSAYQGYTKKDDENTQQMSTPLVNVNARTEVNNSCNCFNFDCRPS